MSEPVTKVRVFVASPSDVTAERDHLKSVVDELNMTIAPHKGLVLDLVRWETHCHPDMGRPQGVINKQVGEYDIFVGIMWRRFGTPTGQADSGTEEEFRTAYAKWECTRSPRIMFYFSEAKFSLPKSQRDFSQMSKVAAFREELEKKGLVWAYPSAAEFPNAVRPQLARLLLDLPSKPPTRPRTRRATLVTKQRPSKRRVFIGCAMQDLPLAVQVRKLLASLGVEPVMWSEAFRPGQAVLEQLESLSANVDAAVVILGPETEARRGSVWFELGLFQGKLGRQRILLLASDGVRLPSDLLGIIYMPFDPQRIEVMREHLRRELRRLGII